MMRRLLITSALAGCLLAAGPAEAGPAIPLAALAVSAATAAGTISALTGFALSIALSVASALLAPKPKTPGLMGDGRMHQVRQAITVRRIILGMAKVSGPMTFWLTRGNKSRDNILHEVVALAGHPITAILERYLNERPVTLDANGVATDAFWIRGAESRSLVSLWTYDGTQTTADQVLIDNTDGKWTEDHVGYGIPYVHAQLTYGASDQGALVFPNGIPNCRATILGAAVYDPREAGHDIDDPDTWAWTDNAALLTAHYLKMPEEQGGFGASSSAIDWDLAEAEADICDEVVPRLNLSDTFTAATDDTITLATEDLPDGARFRVVSTGSLPTGLSADTPYWWIRTGAGTGKAAASRAKAASGVAVNITGTGSGTHSVVIRTAAEFQAETVANTLTVDDGSIILVNGTQVRVESTGTLPSGLAPATDYYWIWDSPTVGRLATDLRNARRRVAINFVGNGVGTHTIVATGEPRWTVNGTIDTDEAPIKILEDLRKALGFGQIVKVGGLWRIRAGRWREPDLTITDRDMRQGDRVLSDAIGRRSGANGVRGTYISPALNWQPGDFPPVQNAGYVEDDAGEELWSDLELPFTISTVAAQRIAKIDLERRRRVKRMELPCNLRVLPAWAGQIVTLDFARYRGLGDWPEAGKTFEIDTVAVGEGFGIDVSLSEVDEDIWAWDPLADEQDVDPVVLLTSEPPDVADPESIVATSDADTAVDEGGGRTLSRIAVSWTFPDDETVTGYEFLAYYTDDQGTHNVHAAAPPDATRAYIDGVNWGETYRVFMRAVRGGIRGAWIEASGSPVLVVGDETPPTEPRFANALALGPDSVEVSWITPEDGDFRRSRIYRSTTADFATATVVPGLGALFALPGWADEVIDDDDGAGLTPSTTYYYWATALDSHNNESGPSLMAFTTTHA